MAEIEKLTDQELARRAKLPRYEELGVYPFGHKFERNAFSTDVIEKYKDISEEDLLNCTDEVIVAGRIRLLRKMGKASFFNVQDKKGIIQCYIKWTMLVKKITPYSN